MVCNMETVMLESHSMEAIKHLCIQADVMFKLKKFKSAAGDLWVLNFDDCSIVGLPGRFILEIRGL